MHRLAFYENIAHIKCIMNPIKPMNRMPIPDTLTIILSSSLLGFLVILKTLIHSRVNSFKRSSISLKVDIGFLNVIIYRFLNLTII